MAGNNVSRMINQKIIRTKLRGEGLEFNIDSWFGSMKKDFLMVFVIIGVRVIRCDPACLRSTRNEDVGVLPVSGERNCGA